MSASSRANIEITASSNRLARGLAAAQAKVRGWAETVARGVGATIGKTRFNFGDTAKNALAHFGGNLMTMGFNSLVRGAEDVRDFERGLTRFGIAARQTPAQLSMLRQSIDDISRSTGKSRDEVLGGARSFVDLAGAGAFTTKKLQLLANVSQATGAEMGDVVSTVYGLGDALKVSDTDMEATLSGLINQSKDGAVHFNQLAAEITRVAPRFARFGTLGRQGAIQFGALFQVMRPGFKDADAAATGMESMLRGIILHAKNFERAGVQIYKIGPDGKKMLLPALELFTAIGNSKLAKDPTLLAKAFGRGEGEQGFDTWSKHVDLFNQLVEAGQKATTVQEDLARYTQSDAGRIDKAFNDIKLTIAEAFTPERITAFASAVETAARGLSKVAGLLDRTMSFWSPSKEEGTAQAAYDLLHAAHRAPKKGVWERGLLGHDETQDEVEQQAIDQAKALLAGGTGAQAVAKIRYGSLAAGQAGARQFLESEGYVMTPAGPDNTAWGRVYRKNAGPDVNLKTLQATLSRLTPEAIAGALAGALQKAGLAHPRVDVGRDKIVDGARSSSRHATGVSHG